MADNKEDDNNKKENQRPDLKENDTITTISIGVAKNDEENNDKDEFCEDECCTAVEICEDECCTAEADEENGVMTSVEFDQLLESQNGKENNQNGEQESGPDEGRSRFFSLAQITVKMSDLFESVKERVFGDDYWIPSDPFEVAEIKPELLTSYKILYPAIEKIGETPLVVIQGTIKKDPPVKLNHVVYTCAPEDGCSKKRYFTIFRSRDLEEALDFCRRCEECRVLFRLFDQKMDIRKSIWDITYMMKNHPLWRMVHIAIYCQRTDIFTDDGLKYLKKSGYTEYDLTKVPCSPEGKHPLLMAVEKNQEAIVKFLLKIGADPTLCDPAGNYAWHYAALVSKEMLEILWSVQGCRPFLNAKNNNGDTATRIAFQNLNPYCLKMLLAFGGEMMIKTTDKNPLFELMQSKGKTIEMIRILLETSPGIYKERDSVTGNTCLHATLYKTSLMGLLHLKHRELDLNAKNKAGLTPLHQFVIRGDLGLVMCLASYGADLNVKADGSDMTALHMAVSQKNLDITRLLLCLGADPNQINIQGDTPRHLAAKLNAIEFLKSLIICGATRCPSSKVSCVTGCADEKFLQIFKKPSSMPAMPIPATVTKSPTSLVQEFENRTFAKEQQRYNKVLDSEHDAIYDEMINVLNEMAANPGDSNVINVLSLDGGGIRGLVITQILIEVERMMGESVFQYFDWVAGTSTGSIVSAGLASGQTLRQIQRIYMRFKDLVFEARRPHNTMVLETFIQEEMGKDKLLSDIKWPRLVFTTTRADFFPVQLELMRNYKLPASDEENAELGFKNADGLLLWKALRRSSAAPTYFSPVDDKYIDGGIIANNPTLELMHEIQFWNSFNKLKNLPNSVRIGCVLSIGTGSIPPFALAPSHLEIAQNYLTQPITSYNAVLTIGQILVDQVTATEGAPVVRAGTWCISQRTPYFRLSAPLHKDIQMDAKDDAEITRMMWDSMEYIYKHKDYVERLCILLRKVGKAWNRRHLFPQQESKDGQKMQDQQTQTSNPPSPVKEQRK